jgi:hypothetical protein
VPKSIPELPIVDWWYIMFETLEQLTKPLHSYYQNPKKQRWVFILHSICILAFLVDYALLLIRHGSLYHHVAGIWASVAMAALAGIWLMGYLAYSRIQQARSAPTISTEEDRALDLEYQSVSRRVAGAIWAFWLPFSIIQLLRL